MMPKISEKIVIDENEIKLRFVRASGPGGQNVNKVATAVQLFFDVKNSPSLPDEVRQRLLRLAGSRVDAKGILLIDARRFRSQKRNREDALTRLTELIKRASYEPPKRVRTKPTAASVRRRLEDKRHAAKTKRQRRKPASGPEG